MEKKMRYQKSANSSFYLQNLFLLFRQRNTPFLGWGRKRTGRLAEKLAQWFHGDFILLEDGFIRSVGLGIDDSPSFSVVEDDIGIYYDATKPSRLENLLSSYNFENDNVLMYQAEEAISLIKKFHISKYNNAPKLNNELREKYILSNGKKRILVIAQAAGDASLKYGLTEEFSTADMINAAAEENPDAEIYLKVHPDVLSRKKRSDLSIDEARNTCIVIDDDINPLSLLESFDKVYTKTSQMGFEALLLGKECICFGMPFYAGWGATDDRVHCERRKRKLKREEIFAAAYILYTKYFNPYTQKPSDIFDTIEAIVKYRDRNKRAEEAFFFGFSLWKQSFMRPFFPNIKKMHFVNTVGNSSVLDKALRRGMCSDSVIYIWGRRSFEDIERYAEENSVAISRVEDGFIRSVGLGSDLTRPYSLVIDRRGIYFDPTQESDLEYILNYHSFTKSELIRANALRHRIIREKLSKYNAYDTVSLDLPEGRTVVLVPGQVEDDASIRYGAPNMTNLKLMQQVRANVPDAYIIYKPHPDVLAGNRAGQIEDNAVLDYCDHIIKEASIDSILAVSDEVHTMTSLVGFEAIIRGIKVYTYGLPFYAGWGLSTDNRRCKHRKRRLSLDELVAATMLLYPHYIDPLTREPCGAEATLMGVEAERSRLHSSAAYGETVKWRNLIERKLQSLLRLFQRVLI